MWKLMMVTLISTFLLEPLTLKLFLDATKPVSSNESLSMYE